MTRLETRTKESNIYASVWVDKTLTRNESKGLPCAGCGRNRGAFGLRGALSTDQSLVKDLSMSISVGTRKMVIFA